MSVLLIVQRDHSDGLQIKVFAGREYVVAPVAAASETHGESEKHGETEQALRRIARSVDVQTLWIAFGLGRRNWPFFAVTTA